MMSFLRRRSAPMADVAPRVRDTDGDWNEIGDRDPYFGVIAEPRFRTENIDDDAKAEFFSSGVNDIALYLAVLQQRFPGFSPNSALDFGCGVGRLTRALADVTGDATGVDISEGMLREARLDGRPGLSFARTLPDRLVDWVVSIIVFQHIPPERGYGLLRDLLARLAPGGCVSLQFALYRHERFRAIPGGRVMIGSEVTFIEQDMAAEAVSHGEMIMFDYDLTVIFALMAEVGITHMFAEHTDHGGFHGALIHGRRQG